MCPCSHFLRYRLNVFLLPAHKIGCSNFLVIRNPWEKVVEKVVKDLTIFSQKWSKIAKAKKVFLLMKKKLICPLARYCLNVLLPSFPEVGSPKMLEIYISLGKSNGNKWSQMWTFLLKKCLKSLQRKKFFTDYFFFVHSI